MKLMSSLLVLLERTMRLGKKRPWLQQMSLANSLMEPPIQTLVKQIEKELLRQKSLLGSRYRQQPPMSLMLELLWMANLLDFQCRCRLGRQLLPNSRRQLGQLRSLCRSGMGSRCRQIQTGSRCLASRMVHAQMLSQIEHRLESLQRHCWWVHRMRLQAHRRFRRQLASWLACSEPRLLSILQQTEHLQCLLAGTRQGRIEHLRHWLLRSPKTLRHLQLGDHRTIEERRR